MANDTENCEKNIVPEGSHEGEEQTMIEGNNGRRYQDHQIYRYQDEYPRRRNKNE